MITTQDINAFADFANAFRGGFLKTWKANAILMSLTDPRCPIMGDEDRMYSYLDNCLSMEGFRADEIAAIQQWLIEKHGGINV